MGAIASGDAGAIGVAHMINSRWIAPQLGELVNTESVTRVQWNEAGDEVIIHVLSRSVPLYYAGAQAGKLAAYFNALHREALIQQGMMVSQGKISGLPF